MVAYLVSYDLKVPGKKYDDLYSLFKSYPDYYHVLESEWFIASDSSAQEISEAIKKVTDKSDLWFVSKITSGYYGWLSEDAWKWLNKYV